MKVKVHLPIPADCYEQSDIVIEEIFPTGGSIAPSDAPQRTVCWQETMKENHPFSVEYSYTYTATFHDTNVESDVVDTAAQPNFYTEEKQPHIAFTPYIKALAESLTKGVSSPMEKARIFYDFITLNMRYTFMPQYFVLESIAEMCARNYTGDCGVFASVVSASSVGSVKPHLKLVVTILGEFFALFQKNVYHIVVFAIVCRVAIPGRDVEAVLHVKFSGGIGK